MRFQYRRCFWEVNDGDVNDILVYDKYDHVRKGVQRVCSTLAACDSHPVMLQTGRQAGKQISDSEIRGLTFLHHHL